MEARQLQASNEAIRLLGVTLIGATPENLRKLLLTFAIIAIVFATTWALRTILRTFIGTRGGTRFNFWARQVVSLIMALILVLAVASVWFDNPSRLATVIGLLGAGLALRPCDVGQKPAIQWLPHFHDLGLHEREGNHVAAHTAHDDPVADIESLAAMACSSEADGR